MPPSSKKKAGGKEKWNVVDEDLYNETVVSAAELSEASSSNRTNNKLPEKGKRVSRLERHTLQQARTSDSQPGFGDDPFAQAIEAAKPAFKIISCLGDQYAKYFENVKTLHLLQQERDDLRSECDLKTADIDGLKSAIRALEHLRGEREEEFRQESERIVEDRRGLDDEIDKFQRSRENGEKRLVARLAELELVQRKALEELKVKQNEEFAKREGERERLSKKEKAELEIQRKKLGESYKQLQVQLSSQQKIVVELQLQLEDEKVRCDEQARVKDSFKEDRDKLKMELGELKKEFSMDGKTPEFYQARFHELSELVETIATKQVNELDQDDAERVRELLKSTNSPFQFMPISDSDESQKLLSASIQCSISKVLCQTIWKPFSSDKTLANPHLASHLEEMVNALSSLGTRKSRIMKMLINQSLQRPLSSGQSNPSPQTAGASSSTCTRSQHAINDISNLISWHSSPRDSETTRKAIQELVDKAIFLWDHAQVDQLNISVTSILNSKAREQWTSPKLADVTDSKTTLKPDAEIFTLFPSVVAYPLPISTPDNGPENKAILIHPGRGLPAASRLVALGRKEEFSRQKIMEEEMEQLRRRVSSRISLDVGQGRRGSPGSGNVGMAGARVQGGTREVGE